MLLSLVDIFDNIRELSADYDFEVTCSYLEVYNELIYDLLVKNSASLELREDPEKGAIAVGLKKIEVKNTDNVMDLLREGNSRRKTEPTEANAVSSRSHAVLEIGVRRSSRAPGYKSQMLCGKLALVDLAGSERASETLNVGQKLRDGANINRSLLALANCINALGKAKKGAYVPYRNSKLTRLLKDGLSGNSRTVMVANVSCGSDQYNHTINTLKYADRAKEIKTHVVQNLQTVESHISDYQRLIDNLQGEVATLKTALKRKETEETMVGDSERGGGVSSRVDVRSAGGASSSPQIHDDSWLDELSEDINENVEERINLQKALFELEDMNIQNKCELVALDDRMNELGHLPPCPLDAPGGGGRSSGLGPETSSESVGALPGIGGNEVDVLKDRRINIVENIRDNKEAGLRYRADIEINEQSRRAIQARIDTAIQNGRSPSFLRILSQYRIMGVSNMELHFQLAIRDQIISDQREVISCLWRIMDAGGIDQERAMQIARKEGILVDYDGSKETEGAGSEPIGRGGGGAGASNSGGPLPEPEELAPRRTNGGGPDEDSVLQGKEVNLLHEKSVVGARAKARFDFWQNFEGVEVAESADVGAAGGAVLSPTVRRSMGGEGVAGGEGVLPAMSRAPATAAVARNGIGATAGVRAESGIGNINGIGTGEGEDKPTVRHSHVVPGVAVTVAGRYGASTDRPVRAPRASASKIRSNGNGALTDRSAPVRRSYESINHSDRSRPHSQGSDIGSVGASASAGGGSGMSSRVGSRGNSRVSSARGDPKPQGHVIGHAAAVAHVPTAAPDHQRAVAAGATTSTTRRSAALGNLTSRRRASRPGSATADGDDGGGGGRAPGASAPAVGGVLASTPVRVTHSSGSNGGDSSKMTDKVQDKVLNKVSDKTSNKVADKAPTQGKRGGPPPSASAVNRAGRCFQNPTPRTILSFNPKS